MSTVALLEVKVTKPDGNRTVKVDPEMIRCPVCGKHKDVRMAGIYEYPDRPEKWFCRCTICNKSFIPRVKKEGAKMEIVQENKPLQEETVALAPEPQTESKRKDITKEQYLELKEQGMSDRYIREQHGLYAGLLVKMKREWGIPIGNPVAQKGNVSSAITRPRVEEDLDRVTMTVAQAINRMAELNLNIESSTMELERIKQAFAQTEIQI